jgi:cell division protease FtsH
MEDFETARDRVLMGQKRDAIVHDATTSASGVAYHESGHALLAYVLDKTDPAAQDHHHPARHGARRHHDACPKRIATSMSRQHLEDSLCMRMGGRVAELLDLRRPVDRRR